MSNSVFAMFALQLAAMLVCAMGCGYLMRRAGQPAVLGEMIGGIILGPTVFGTLVPGAYQWLFAAGGAANVLQGGAIKLGMLFFIFIVGLEINLSQLVKHGWTAILVGTIGTVVPLACGAAVVYAMPDIWGPAGDYNRLMLALFIGAAMANSANPVLARILVDLGLLKKNIGAVLMSATLIDDLVGWALLAVIFGGVADKAAPQGTAFSGLAGAAVVVGFFAAVLIAGRFVGVPLLRLAKEKSAGQSGCIGATSAMIVLSAAASEALGLHAFLGPFVLGIALASRSEQYRVANETMNQFVMGFFVPIYFASMGLTANFATSFDPVLVGVVIAVAFLSKISSVTFAAWISGLDRRTSLAIGFGMNARGATGIILATLGREQGLINEPVYVALVVMCLVTSLIAGPAMKVLLDGSPLLASSSPQPAMASV